MFLSPRRLFVAILMLALFTMTVRDITDPDFWWHLRTGEYIVATHTIPHTDIYSHTVLGSEWVAHEWLSEVLIFALYRWLGFGGLIVTFSLFITAAFWITYLRCAGRPFVAGLALIVGALATAPTWGVRPQMLTLLLASIYLFVLNLYVRTNSWRLFVALVPLMILWVNLHSGFAFGLGLIALYAVGVAFDEAFANDSLLAVAKRVLPLVIVFVVCVLVVPLNPNGARMYSYPFQTLTSSAMQTYIQEWFSPDFHQIEWQPFALLIFATFGSMALSRARIRIGDVLVLLVLAYMGLRSTRNIPFFALAAIPLFAEHAWDFIVRRAWGAWLNPTHTRTLGMMSAVNVALLLILLAASSLRVVQVVRDQKDAVAQAFPTAAVDYVLKQKPPAPLFNPYTWGGYLIWRLYPHYLVYVDGRADVYGDLFLEYYLSAYQGGANWQKPLDDFRVRTVLVEADAPLVANLRASSEWKLVYEDKQAVIFTR